MKDLSKRFAALLPREFTAAHWLVRIGPGERQVVRAGKAYHAQCEAKVSSRCF